MRSLRSDPGQHPARAMAPGDYVLQSRRLVLRPLQANDFKAWREVRLRNVDWLTPWEPRKIPGQSDPSASRDAFAMRCSARSRERQLGTGFGFGLFVDGVHFGGEINLNSVQRGPFQNAYVGYWVDQIHAGKNYIPEGLVAVAKCAFEQLQLHRIQIAIIPRNTKSRRVVEKLGIREEGVARRYLEINGHWEDHVRYAMTSEDWAERGEALTREWLHDET